MFSTLTPTPNQGQHYRIAVYCGEAPPGDQPRLTRWAIFYGPEGKPVIQGHAATSRAAEDAALRAFACMLGT